jgi:hypothetical protein
MEDPDDIGAERAPKQSAFQAAGDTEHAQNRAEPSQKLSLANNKRIFQFW